MNVLSLKVGIPREAFDDAEQIEEWATRVTESALDEWAAGA